MAFFIILLSTFGLGLIGMKTVQALGWPSWSYHLLMIGLGVILYFLNVYLIRRFTLKRSPDLAGDDEVVPGVQAWELTAGLGVVPKWVSIIGLLAVGALLASPFELVASLLRN